MMMFLFAMEHIMGGYTSLPIKHIDEQVVEQFYKAVDEKFQFKKEDINITETSVQVVAGTNIRFEYMVKNQNCEVVIWKKLDKTLQVTRNICKSDIA